MAPGGCNDVTCSYCIGSHLKPRLVRLPLPNNIQCSSTLLSAHYWGNPDSPRALSHTQSLMLPHAVPLHSPLQYPVHVQVLDCILESAIPRLSANKPPTLPSPPALPRPCPSALTDDVELGPALQVLLALAADGHQLDLHAELSQLAEAPLGLQTGELQGVQACQLSGSLWIGAQPSVRFRTTEQWLQVAGITTPALP